MQLFAKKATGPDDATLRAQADEQSRLNAQEQRAAAEAGSRQRMLNANGGNGSPVTLFQGKGTAKLGGSPRAA